MLQRDEALALVKSFSPEPNMLQHALASEAVMRALAEHFDENADLWGLAGLVHDVDYPLTKDSPEQHGVKAADVLEGKVPADIVYAVQAHCSDFTGKAPRNKLDYALRAAETVTGLISAAALVRPEGMVGMKVSSVKKKMKDKAFAASVNRDNIRECEHTGLTLEEFLEIAIRAMS